MDNHFKLVVGKEARQELNTLGYEISGCADSRDGFMSLMLSMAKQIKDLQDKIIEIESKTK